MVDLGKLNLPRQDEWYWENGYLTIDLELFGKYLSIIFSKCLGDYYSFQTFTPKIQTRKDIPIWYQDEEERKMAIISPVSYDVNYKKYNETKITCVWSSRSKRLVPYTIYSKEYESLFSKEPLEVNKKDFLLYFGEYNCAKVKLTLGYIEDKKFVCHIFPEVKNKEVKYNNPQYSFIEEFAKAIFYYKIVNIKPDINENDMEEILSYFGITREEMTDQLIGILKNVQQNSIEMLLSSNNVKDTIKLIKTKNKFK